MGKMGAMHLVRTRMVESVLDRMHLEAGQALPGEEYLQPRVRGKFFFQGERKIYLRGVTYGTFRPNDSGEEFPSRGKVEEDFAQMSASGINTVRTYTAPPIWLLDIAERWGLKIMAGLPVERSIAFFDYRECARSIEYLVRNEVHARAGHPAILCYTIGNEIPASIVRWHGGRKIERYLERLHYEAKSEDPDSLVTYVNYPSTEYLQLPFLDFICFNVYLESPRCLESYLARLQVIAGNRPLVMGELGLDSLRNGEKTQEETLDWQVRLSFSSGCAGVYVYSWTDEWYRGGADVHDWRFGITDRERNPKPALRTVSDAFREAPVRRNIRWPRISVVVCTYNGSKTIADCLDGLRRIRYPNFEVIVVDDGSTDKTAEIVQRYPARLIRTSNRGLSSARNTGWRAATGEIVAYLDDDAYPDIHWLDYLAWTFLNTNHSAVGGPNIAPSSDGPIAECIAYAPGGPTHVLLSDRQAEHIPGCNMAFRKQCLHDVGGFDPQFRVAGDDVDMCWKLQQAGHTIGFSPAAMVWHHRRRSVRAYLRQQRGYGKAEALLEKKWPEKYNIAGYMKWSGRIYGVPFVHWRANRVYHGTWGLAPFQSLYEPPASLLDALPTLPEWYLLTALLGLLCFLSSWWRPLALSYPLLVVTAGAPLVNVIRSVSRLCFVSAATRAGQIRLRILTGLLFVLQPLARLEGRLRQGLTLWRMRVRAGLALPRPWLANIWSRHALSMEQWLQFMEAHLRSHGAVPLRGNEFDPWDLEVRGGFLGSARMFVAVEHHGDGRQLLRVRSWPRLSIGGVVLAFLFVALALDAVEDLSWVGLAVFGSVSVLLISRMVAECAGATAAFLGAVRKIEREEGPNGGR